MCSEVGGDAIRQRYLYGDYAIESCGSLASQGGKNELLLQLIYMTFYCQPGLRD